MTPHGPYPHRHLRQPFRWIARFIDHLRNL